MAMALGTLGAIELTIENPLLLLACESKHLFAEVAVRETHHLPDVHSHDCRIIFGSNLKIHGYESLAVLISAIASIVGIER